MDIGILLCSGDIFARFINILLCSLDEGDIPSKVESSTALL